MNKTNQADLLLIERISEGSSEALQTLVSKYMPRISMKVRHFYLLYGYNTQMEYEDLLQEARLSLIIAARTFNINSMSSFYAYWNSVCDNQLRSYRYQYVMKTTAKTFDTGSSLDSPYSERYSYNDVIGENDAKIKDNIDLFDMDALVDEIITHLTPFETRVFKLLLITKDKSEIAKTLECNLKRVYRAIIRIKEVTIRCINKQR